MLILYVFCFDIHAALMGRGSLSSLPLATTHDQLSPVFSYPCALFCSNSYFLALAKLTTLSIYGTTQVLTKNNSFLAKPKPGMHFLKLPCRSMALVQAASYNVFP